MRDSLKSMVAWASQNPALFWIVYALGTACLFPGVSVLTPLAGALFGFWEGLILVCTASTLGGGLSFLVARHWLRSWVARRWGRALQRVDTQLSTQGPRLLFSLRVFPVLPFFVLNPVMGLTPIRLGTFLLVSFIGMVPGNAVWVNAGLQMTRAQRWQDVFRPEILGSLLLIAVLPWLLRKRRPKSLS